MTDIQRLLHLNVEIEGLLRVLQSRDSSESRTLLMQKFEQFTALMVATFPNANDAGSYVAIPLGNPEVKNQEAETSEVDPEEDAAEAAIERGSMVPETVASSEVRPEVKLQEAEVAEIEPQDEAAEAAIARGSKKNEPLIPLSKAFTLNDRFRFRRELFNSNDADFTDTLNLISEMESYSEAEDYLLHDLMWNPENPSVVDFLEIISRCLPDG